MVAVVIILLILFILVPMVLGGLFLTCTWPFDKTKWCIVSKINDGEIDSDFFEDYLKEEVLDVADLPSSITESEYDDVVDHFGDDIKDDKLREAIAAAGIVIIADDGDDEDDDGDGTSNGGGAGDVAGDEDEVVTGIDTEEDGAPTGDYKVVNDKEGYSELWDPGTVAPNRPSGGFSLEQCKEACDAEPSCTRIAYSEIDRDCYLSSSTATFTQTPDLFKSYMAYAKDGDGGGSATDDTEEDGALTGYDIVGDRGDYGEWWLQHTEAPNKPPRGFSLEQCGQACDADSSCTKISYSATHGICLLSKSDATLFDEDADPSFKAYKKVTGGV